MGQLGSVSSPSFAGWQWVGTSGYAFAALYTVPSGPDILISDIYAYFDTYSGSGAHGYLMIWDGNDSAGNPVLYQSASFIINNGSKAAGGQEWWHKSGVNLQVAGGSKLWIGGYCDQGIIWSTYDTSPHTFDKAMGSPLPGTTYFNSPYRTDTGQGPPGAYVLYGNVVKGSAVLGASSSPSGGLIATGVNDITPPGGAFRLGMRSPSGLTVTGIIYNYQANYAGMNGTGGLVVSTSVRVPQIKIWRAS